jgi:hypothetical protein
LHDWANHTAFHLNQYLSDFVADALELEKTRDERLISVGHSVAEAERAKDTAQRKAVAS